MSINIDEVVNAILNLQVTQMMLSSLQHAFTPPGPVDAFGAMFQGLFQMLMPILFMTIFMKMIEKLG